MWLKWCKGGELLVKGRSYVWLMKCFSCQVSDVIKMNSSVAVWKLPTYEAYDAADKRVEVTTVSCHDGFLLGQQSFPRRLHHIHGHLANENLHTRERRKNQQVKNMNWDRKKKTYRIGWRGKKVRHPIIGWRKHFAPVWPVYINHCVLMQPFFSSIIVWTLHQL